MKLKCIYIAVILLLGISASAQPPNQPGPFDGLQSSLNEFITPAAITYGYLQQQYDEYARLAMLRNSDIRMKMNTRYDSSKSVSSVLPRTWLQRTAHDASLSAEFDWQNMAEKMNVKKDSYKNSAMLVGLELGKHHEAKDYDMYIDAQGFWYIPTTGGNYLRVNLMRQLQDQAAMLEVALEAAIETRVSVEGMRMRSVIDILANISALLVLHSDPSIRRYFPPELLEILSGNPSEEILRPMLQNMVMLQHEQLSSFPAFIHFAFIFSPTVARTQFDMREETISYRGNDNCAKMTVLSGNDAGFEVIFDQYGRLIHLKDTKGDTAEYWYDRDVTVNIPPSYSFPGSR